MHFIYILECSDHTFYTGYSTDVSKRLKTHNAKKGARYTRSRTPCRLVYFESFQSKQEAMSREWHLKKLSRKEKEVLIRSDVLLPAVRFCLLKETL